MKLEQFLESPSPKGGIKIPTNEIIEKHRESYNKTKSKIRSNVYTVDRKNYIVLVRIPSGNVKDFTYDCIIEFNKMGESLEESHIKIFSNSPSFVFSFAYVFYHIADEGSTGMIADKFAKLIPEKRLTADITDKKLGPEVLHGEPVIRNPYGIPLLDKTLYHAIFHILEKYTVKTLVRQSRMINERFLINNVKSFEKTMLLREKMIQNQKKLEIKEDVKSPRIQKELIRQVDEGNNVNVNYLKGKREPKIRVKPSENVTRVKAAKTSMTVIKKMK